MDVAEVTSEEVQGSEAPAEEPIEPAGAGPLVEADLLVEDVSIDGMCGVY
jgi:mycofactocin precursor